MYVTYSSILSLFQGLTYKFLLIKYIIYYLYINYRKREVGGGKILASSLMFAKVSDADEDIFYIDYTVSVDITGWIPLRHTWPRAEG